MVGGWWGLHSRFHAQHNYSVEAVLWLYCVVVGFVTIHPVMIQCSIDLIHPVIRRCNIDLIHPLGI